MSRARGIRSFEGLRSRAESVVFGHYELLIAGPADIIISNAPPVEAAASPSWPSWRKPSMNRTASNQTTRAQETALKRETDRALVEQIRRLLALPMNKRTHFLRVQHPSGGSHL